MTVELQLRSMPGREATPDARVRRLLKAISRQYGFRVLRHRINDDGKPIPPDPEIDASKTEPPF
jgi:hypothetical protein